MFKEVSTESAVYQLLSGALAAYADKNASGVL